jgi:cyclopropane fatty-acyl-phospholipid synthase-like methyltransferase
MRMSEKMWDRWNRQWGTKYPHDKIVQFCCRNFRPQERHRVRALDLGCGSGVHTVFLAHEGFQVTGVDISEVGLANTRRRLDELGLAATLRLESADALDFPDASVDLVVSVGVFESAGPAISAAAVLRLRRMLSSGGRGIFLFASDRDDAVKQDREWGMHGYARDEVDEMFAVGYSEVCVDCHETTYRGGRSQQSEWLVTVEN